MISHGSTFPFAFLQELQFDRWTFAGLRGISNFNFSFSCTAERRCNESAEFFYSIKQTVQKKEECTFVFFGWMF
jgi:hypothetical protein